MDHIGGVFLCFFCECLLSATTDRGMKSRRRRRRRPTPRRARGTKMNKQVKHFPRKRTLCLSSSVSADKSTPSSTHPKKQPAEEPFPQPSTTVCPCSAVPLLLMQIKLQPDWSCRLFSNNRENKLLLWATISFFFFYFLAFRVWQVIIIINDTLRI